MKAHKILTMSCSPSCTEWRNSLQAVHGHVCMINHRQYMVTHCIQYMVMYVCINCRQYMVTHRIQYMATYVCINRRQYMVTHRI